MQTKSNPSERGQAIVLIVLAIIALLGFTALAVDGSLVYSDRRWAQNAADASALAGAGAAAEYLEYNYIHSISSPWRGSGNSCAGVAGSAAVQSIAAAIARASENDYNLPNGITTNFGGVEVECGVDEDNFDTPYLDVTVVISETTDTAFAQVVFPGGLANTTTAVARVEPAIGMGNGNAIVALDPTQCTGGGIYYGIKVNGARGQGLTLNDGGMWSNGCLEVAGNPNVVINDGGDATFFDPGNDTVDGDNDIVFNGLDGNGEGGGFNDLNSPDETGDDDDYMPVEAYTLPSEPLCNKTSNQYTPETLLPRIRPNEPQTWVLQPGLYCIYNRLPGQQGGGQGQGQASLDIRAGDIVNGTNVTIVLVDVTLSINGGATVNLSAPANPPVGPYYDAIPGLLFYAPTTNTRCGNGCITLNGTASSRFRGTILAPGGEVIFDGTHGADIFGQIIAYDVDIGGSAISEVTYDPNNVVVLSTFLSMKE